MMSATTASRDPRSGPPGVNATAEDGTLLRMGRTKREKRRKAHRARPAAASPPPKHEARAGRPAAAPSPGLAGPGSEAARQRLVAAAVLGGLVVAAYFPAFLAGFVWDDRIFTGTPLVRDWSGLWRIWFSPAEIENEAHYWPLLYTTFWLEHKLWGLTPRPATTSSTCCCTSPTPCCCGGCWRGLAVPGAWVVAAVFAVHPLHVESVVWIMERKDVLSTGCSTSPRVSAWIRFVEETRRETCGSEEATSWRWRCSCGGLLSKSIVVTLPAALVHLALVEAGPRHRRRLGYRLAPFFAVGLGLVRSRTWRSPAPGRPVVPRLLDDRAGAHRGARASGSTPGKLLWPAGSGRHLPALGGEPRRIHAGMGLRRRRGGAGRGAVAAPAPDRPGAAGRGVLFFTVTLSPVLGFVDYGYMQFSFVADRYQYLASIGVLGAVVGAAACGLTHVCAGGVGRWGAAGVVLLAVGVLGTLTWRQAGIYQDKLTFYSHIVSHNPTARSAQYNLGTALLDAQRPEDALAAFRLATEQRPDHVKAHTNTGTSLMRLGRTDEAAKSLRRALEINPRHGISLLNLAAVEICRGRYGEALTLYQRLIEVEPRRAAAHAGMSIALRNLGRTDEALRSIDLALALDPTQKHALRSRELIQKSLQQSGQ